ncbi:MAG: response regulator [Chloroflexi bacterium]|nr:response regulator [Chloroflexota bacterium]MBI3338803.1 response regulator [Chloroflexota bacterium]
MPRVLFIDDEPLNYQLVAHALEPLKCELHYAENGKNGVERARNIKPDIIITDVMMPEINGYEVTRLLRRDLQFSSTPILVLTAQSGLQDKLKSFEAGADDHLTKPFEAAELAARVASLLRRAETAKMSRVETAAREGAHMIAIHSLRGGTGCSSLATNLGVGLAGLWMKPVALLDLTMTAGQVALMLNMTLRRTWADIARFEPAELDADVVASILSLHESGLSFIAAPTFPSQAETLRGETLGTAIRLVKSQNEYVIADLPHDFSEPAIQALDAADVILMVATPDMASIRAVTAAMDTYEKLGYPREKIKFLLSATFPHSSLLKEKIEAALGTTALATIPYVQDVFVDAINLGQPVVYARPDLPVSGLLEDFAFHLSKDAHKKAKPENPTETWKRVYKRFQERKK